MQYYTDYMSKRKERARERFKDHKATVVQKDENFFVLDWRHISGTGDYFVRYILDIKRGAFIISGDLGDCIACWYNEVSPENLASYISDIAYFIGKFQCSSDKYSYNQDDIDEDLNAIKKEYLDNIDDFWNFTREEVEEDFEDMQRILNDFQPSENGCYPDELTELFSKYDDNWYESSFSDLGRRISQRVVLWAEGYRMAMQQITE